MTRHVVTFALVTMFAASATAVLDAQRGGGARMGAANMGGAAGPSTGGVRGGGPRGGGNPGPGAGAGRGGGAGRGSGGFRFQGRVNTPPALRSINRPSFPVDGLNRPAFPLSGPLGFGPQPRSPFDARRGTFTRIHPFNSFGAPFGYGAAYGPSYEPESTYDKLYRTPQPEETTGALFLDVMPSTALVFVDSALVGSVADLQARGVMLSQGRHWLDLEAPGYEKKTIEITIRAGEPLRYRFDMVPVRTAAVTVVPERPETMYAIPGCYGGNRPPVAANLPRGCDIAKIRVIRPQPRVN
ncbi:MAG TPA: hypothetical protein VEP46_00375 [Vicinamibacterales bacterium]|nr:hypothetical protein [Vicinamibacterales bacterium]